MIDRDHAEAIEFYATRPDADRELAEILHDEPDWVGRFGIVIVRLLRGGARRPTDRRSSPASPRNAIDARGPHMTTR